MKALQTLIFSSLLFLALVAPGSSAEPVSAEDQVRSMFDAYLDVYNRRFASSDGDRRFREEIVDYLYTPLVMFPPGGAPRIVATPEQAAANFAGFTAQLVGKGVTRLQWQSLQLRELTPTKVLANAVGHGIGADGQLAYETASVYLVFRAGDEWRIQTLSPYLVANRPDLAALFSPAGS